MGLERVSKTDLPGYTALNSGRMMITTHTGTKAAGRWSCLVGCLLLCLLVARPLVAQPAAPPASAQLDRDVQLLLDNDDQAVAILKQLQAREITNVEYTKRQQDLTKARYDILGHYDRAGQRQLVALYNAAKRDKAIAA